MTDRTKLLPSGAIAPPQGGAETPLSVESIMDPDDESSFLLPASERASRRDNYGSSGTPPSRAEETIRALPTRLTRTKSEARKAERRQRRSKQWKNWRQRATYYIPVLAWLPDYRLKAFSGDVVAAITVTALIVPQSMSYATNLAGLPPISGLFAVSIPAIIYSVLGTCRQLSVGPEAALSLIYGEFIGGILRAERHAHPHLSALDQTKLTAMISSIITFEAGLISFGLGLVRLGFLDAVLSRALLRGFITAVGLVIFVRHSRLLSLKPTLLVPLLGLEPELARAKTVESTIDKIAFVARNLRHTHHLTLAISLVALAFLISAKLFKARLVARRGFRFLAFIPEVLLVVIISTVCTSFFDWDQHGVEVLGRVSTGSISLSLPFVNTGGYWRKCLGTSSIIAVLGFLDSIVAAKSSSAKYDYPVSPNRELVALGAANIVVSTMSGALGGYGSLTRSRLAGSVGATTQMTSLLTGVFVLFVTYFLLGFLFYLPKAILSVIICVVVFSILAETPHDVKFFWKMGGWTDGALMLLTFLLTFFVNVEVGIVVSVAVSMMLCIKQSSSMRIKILGRVPGTDFYEPVEEEDDDGLLFSGEEIPGVLIVRLRDASLTFANAGALKERLRRLERYGKGRHHPSDNPRRAEAAVIIFHLADVDEIDASALQLILEVVEAYVTRHALVYWTGVQSQPLARLELAGVLKLSGGASHVHPTVQSALNAMNETGLSPQNVP